MTIVFTLACIIGIVVPLLLIFVFYKGIERSAFAPLQKSRYKALVIRFAIAWALAVWLLGATNIFAYHPGDILPRFLVPLMLPVLAGLLLLRNRNFRIILDNTPLSFMIGMQTFRFLGVLFLFVVNENLAPIDFTAGGYGDIITGLLALLAAVMLTRKANTAIVASWAFTVAGVADLLNVAAMLLFYYPVWSLAEPSSAGAANFPLILVLGLAAPFALTFHVYTIRKLVFATQDPKAIH